MSKTIPKDEFLAGKQCLRCGIFGQERICEICKPLKKCEVCSIILRKSFRFYRYDPNKRGTVYREHTYIIKSPYPPMSELMCKGCDNWEDGMKLWCFKCGEWFENTLNNYKINGNFCDNCNGNEL